MFKKQIRHDESITVGYDKVIPTLTFKSDDVDNLKVQVVKKDGYYTFYSNFRSDKSKRDEYEIMHWIPGEVIMGINL